MAATGTESGSSPPNRRLEVAPSYPLDMYPWGTMSETVSSNGFNKAAAGRSASVPPPHSTGTGPAGTVVGVTAVVVGVVAVVVGVVGLVGVVIDRAKGSGIV